MTIGPGTKLGRYETRSQLGAGGMGEVYLARDPKINRDVAIKVLPEAFSLNSERLRRFEQEAQAIGKLNHPNILSVFDVDTHDGAPYVVYELLEGETLRECLNHGALSTRKAVDYAMQIAQGLAAAHNKGIIHRDLKPENIFITHDNRVKILDFGLAKLTEPVQNPEHQTDVPTRNVNTDPGAVMGTVGYMSPEQVKAQRVDHRSDIFSLGCVLYEMISGKRAFRRESAIETLNAILREDPPGLFESNSQINPALERVVMHCLEKNPDQRFQSARDVAFALDALSGLSSSRTLSSVLPVSGRLARLTKRELLAWVFTGILLLTLVATLPLAVGYLRRPAENVSAATRFSIYAPEKTELRGSFAVSPDGQRVVLRGIAQGKVLLWMRALDSLTIQPLAGTEEAIYPFWSSDSRFIGFFSGGKLKKIEASGGPVQTLCDATEGRGGAWNSEGVIIFAPREASPLYRVPAAGGAPVPLTKLDESRKEVSHLHPHFLPDGRHFLYLAMSPQRESAGIYVGSLDKQETKLLVNSDFSAIYAPGYLLFLRDRTLMAQSFDDKRLELVGEPFPVAEEVDSLRAGFRFALFSVSQTGVLVYRSGSSDSSQLIWFDREGKQLGMVGPRANYAVPWLSPDEKRVAFSGAGPEGGNADIWLIELARGTLTRFTFDPAADLSPVWSPDGSRILFASDRDGIADLYVRAASGAGKDEALVKSNNRKIATDWSMDGKFILYQENDPKTGYDIWVLPLSGEQKPFPFLQTEFDERQGRFSPDGKWIAYVSNESGKWQVYVQSFPAPGSKWQVSTDGGAQPQWRRDGKELFYLAADRKIMAVDTSQSSHTFDAGALKALFELRIQSVGLPGIRNFYAASGDGQRFLVTALLEEPTTTPTTVVLNWTADLKK